jgi:iodotyrosine deiodinase
LDLRGPALGAQGDTLLIESCGILVDAQRVPLPQIPYAYPRSEPKDALSTLTADRLQAEQRRTVRHFSSESVPKALIEEAIRIAGTAPSGAHREPWFFCAISDIAKKRRIREAAEIEEREFYARRATPEWIAAIEPLGTDFVKAHLTEAPWVLVVFRRDVQPGPDGTILKSYYAQESVGIAVGFLIQALHRVGLATLTHTPAPMTFLRDICGRPSGDKPFVLMPIGYPHPEATVPSLRRKTLEKIASFE